MTIQHNFLKSSEDSPTRKKVRLGEYLLSKKQITEPQLYAALEEQKVTHERLGLILTRNGFLSRKNLLAAILATNQDQIHGESFFTARVPGDVLIKTKTMVVAETEKEIFLATLTSETQARIEIAEYYPEASLVFVAANYEQVDAYLEDVRALLHDDDSLVDKIIRRAFAEGVSDIHIVPRHNSYTIFFRHLGVRHHVHEGHLDEYTTLAARIKDLSRMDLAERRLPQDGGFQMEYNGKLVDLRVATVPIAGAQEYLVLRLLDPDRVQPSLHGLGITRVAEWRKGVTRPDGLCLICGPTGSGKTTTLNASVREMDRFERSIFTVEDPVEYRISYLAQVNANPELGLNFARALRAFMRNDPDVIIVGEIRDAETASIAVKAAETGHLVLGTLHTGSIHGAVQRLQDLGVPSHELVYLLRTVLVQRLIRTTCTHCQGTGCKTCSGTGYGGRSIVSECAYFAGEEEVNRMMTGKREWPSMLEDAYGKYKEKLTSANEVIRVFGEEARVLIESEAQ
ncbi:Flp pilus assembly complex ATPase component TadA [Nostoc sp. CHAB 5834]|nr:Flp pilus assembly complex ATPase component TadA [Nostoc sp. CHAB 5834]